jgi:RNA polymerase sigma-70 factor (ECF subfamily)
MDVTPRRPGTGGPAPAGDAAERSFVERLRRGDEAAFEELVRSRGGALLAVARRFLRNEEDARDAVQEAFVQAFRGIRSFEEQAKLSTWLRRILVNACLMRLRTRRRKPEEPLDEDLLPAFRADGHRIGVTPAWEDAEERIEREETRRRVRAAIDRLPETARTVLLLRDIEERSTEEAAGLLGITENAVKIRLHRARQALRTLLDRELFGATT